MRNSRRKHHRIRHRVKSLSSVPGQAKAISMCADCGQSFHPPEAQTATLQSDPIIKTWPKGYQGFRFDGNAVVIFASGKADMRIEDAI